MKQRVNRPLSLLLAIMMIVSVFTALPVTTANAATNSYVKVTSEPSDWSGEYLIVYEDGNVAFNGNLTTLDAVSNTISVTIKNNSIASNETTNAAKFIIAKNGDNYSIKSASGYYIGQTSDANGLKANTSTTYSNSISLNSGEVDIVSSGGAYLRYNATSGQTRFRYFKSGTYTGQKAIQLYKLTSSGDDPTTYTVTWKDGDGNTKEIDSDVASGTKPEYNGSTPTKSSDSDYSYSFNGTWSDGTNTYATADLPNVNADVTYTAQFDPTPLSEYTISWYADEDCEVLLDEETYKEGATPLYKGATPTKDSDGTYNYYFNNTWKDFLTDEVYDDDYMPVVSDDAIYIAQFDQALISKYTVTWVDYDSTVLETDTNVNKYSNPSFDKPDPTRADDANFSYSFAGWSPALAPVTADVTYTAVYTATPLNMTGRIVRTDTDTTFSIAGKYYSYKGETDQFEEDGSFDDDYVENELLFLSNEIVADVPARTNAVYAYSVYVTGDGTENNPYVFTPNYIYSKPTASGVGNGAAVTADGTGSSLTPVIPGDSFQKYSKIKVTKDTNAALFLQHADDGEINCSNNYVGVGNGNYGNSYSTTNASPYTFMDGNNTLYYLGTKGSNTYLFTESVPYSDSLGEPAESYTVTWNNYDGTELDSETYYAGQTPSYKGESDPVRAETVSHTFTFNGWSSDGGTTVYGAEDTLPAVSGDVTYTAQYTAVQKESYTVTWYDGDLNELGSETYYEGQDPSYTVNTPTKTAISTARYVFNNSWMDYDTETVYSAAGLPGVSKNTDYIAQFDAINIYTVLWDCDNGDDPIEQTYEEGETPSFPNDDPTKPSHAGHDYTFIGWDPNPAPIHEDTIYTAQYSTEYTVYWYDGNGEELGSDTVTSGTRPAYTGDTPTKEADSTYRYVFNGKWADIDENVYTAAQLPLVSDDAIYTAQFDRIKLHPYVIWYNYNGDELADETYNEGDTPTYKDSTPTKPDETVDGVKYKYEFIGWTPTPAPLTDDEIYTALFTRYAVYTITWQDDEGETLRTDEVREGVTPSYGSEPTKPADGTYTYTFTEWTPEIEAATSNATYTAQFTRIKKNPVVYWLKYNEAIQSQEIYSAGDIPQYKGDTPTKPNSDNYRYTFNGKWQDWNTKEVYEGNNLPALTDDVFYQPMFDEELIPTHTVTWSTHEGTKNTTGHEGAVPSYGGTPADYYDGNVTYAFTGWSDGTNTYGVGETLPVLGSSDITYTAQYKAVPRQHYIVTWNNYDGSEITRECVSEGTIALYPGSEAPARPATGEYSYTFSGWKDASDHSAEPTVYGAEDEMPAVTSDVTYTAVYTEGPSHINGILPTNVENYYDLAGAWFVYNDGDTTDVRQFDTDAYGYFYEDVTEHTTHQTAQGKTYHNYIGVLRIAGEPVDPFSTATPYADGGHKELTHTVYVYGTGTQDDPYEFHMNYLYYDDLHKNVSGADIIKVDIRDMYPGDQFRGNARIETALGDVDSVTFSGDPTVKEAPDNGILGIGKNNYGYKYVNENAVVSDEGHGPYKYGSGKNTIYYYGLNDEGDSYLFTTEEVPVRTDLIGSNDYTDSYLVYWVNWDNSNLPNSPEIYEENEMPCYKGSTPTRSEDDSYTYVFDGWEEEIVPVTYSYATYTAKYKALPKPCTVTWKNYDEEVLETDHCFTNDIPYYNGEDPEKPGYSRFTYTFIGWTDDNDTFYAKDAQMPAVTGDITYTATYTKTSLLFAKHSLTLHGDIGVIFYLDVTEAEVTTGSGVKVDFEWTVKGKKNHTAYTLKSDEFYTDPVTDKTYYKAICWVAAAEMSCKIHATAKINGVLQTETDDYSVRDYALCIINAEEGTFNKQDELVTLAKTMLDYGAKAQVVFDRVEEGISPLANTDVDYTMGNVDASTISSADRDLETGLEDYGLEYYTNSVVFLTKNSLRLYYKITDKDKFDLVKGNITFDGQKVGYTTKGSYIYFELSEIVASDLDADHTLSINGTEYTYSVMDYARDLVNSGVNAYADLGRAIYYYNQAADAYYPEEG